MSKIIRISDSDYKISVGQSGTITLDTGYQLGEVVVTGNLTVLGTSTVIESTSVVINDNIIIVNKGETGAGVSLTTAGLQVDRGSLPDVAFLFDESVSHYDPVTATTVDGTFVIKSTTGAIQGLRTTSISTNGNDLALISSGNGVITVTGTSNYEQNILDYAALDISYDISTYSRASNIATIVTMLPHGFAQGDVINVINYSNPSFSDNFISISSILSPTSFTYANAGPLVTAGPAGSALGVVRPSSIKDDDFVPNMRAVADFIASFISGYSSNKILENDTKVQTYDQDTSGVSAITFNVDNVLRATISTTEFNINDNLSVDNDATVTGDIAINGGNITTTVTSFNLLNSVATTVNAFGAATTIGIGAATGTTNINNSLTVDNTAEIKSVEDSINSLSGALTVSGGVGIAKNVMVGDSVTITNDLAVNGGNLTSSSTTFNIATGVPTINIGTPTGTTVVNNIDITGNVIKDLSSDNLIFDSVLSIANKTVDPGTSAGYVKLYSKDIPGPGGTGLFFVNTQGTNDELISKTKSILYSIIF